MILGDQQFGRVAAQRLLGRPAEQLLRLRAPQGDPAPGVQDHGGHAQDVQQAAGLGGDRPDGAGSGPERLGRDHDRTSFARGGGPRTGGPARTAVGPLILPPSPPRGRSRQRSSVQNRIRGVRGRCAGQVRAPVRRCPGGCVTGPGGTPAARGEHAAVAKGIGRSRRIGRKFPSRRPDHALDCDRSAPGDHREGVQDEPSSHQRIGGRDVGRVRRGCRHRVRRRSAAHHARTLPVHADPGRAAGARRSAAARSAAHPSRAR